ncbi:MAG: carboxylesterase family protein [Planctomycetota bacterium]|jgi:predicted peptidase
MKPVFLIQLALGLMLIAGCATKKIQDKPNRTSTQTRHLFKKKITSTVKINYLLFLPEDYGKTKEKWPVILFLHGADRCGDDLEIVKGCGLPRLVESEKDFSFILISPQMPRGDSFYHHVDMVIGVLDNVLHKYNADPERVYLTGLSMGGYGTWDIGSKYPHRFAAIAPICGGGNLQIACKLKEMPVWAFHGAKDNLVPVSRSKSMVEAINKCGGNAKLTIYPDTGHNAWPQTYNNPEFYEWLLEHRKKQSRK